MQIGKFEDFLKARVKVEGKPGNIGKNVSFLHTGQSNATTVIRR